LESPTKNGESNIRQYTDDNSSIIHNITDNNIYNTCSSNIYIYKFDEFWKIYPKKVNKSKCKILWKKLTETDKKDIINDIPKRLNNDDKWINGFIRDPERYLKYRQWEDEIIKQRTKSMSEVKVDRFN
jgi:hypothetical protein